MLRLPVLFSLKDTIIHVLDCKNQLFNQNYQILSFNKKISSHSIASSFTNDKISILVPLDMIETQTIGFLIFLKFRVTLLVSL